MIHQDGVREGKSGFRYVFYPGGNSHEGQEDRDSCDTEAVLYDWVGFHSSQLSGMREARAYHAIGWK